MENINKGLNNTKKMTLDVYMCDDITYISELDYKRYIGETPERIEKIGTLEIVQITQEQINEICAINGMKAQLQLLKSRERNNIITAAEEFRNRYKGNEFNFNIEKNIAEKNSKTINGYDR